MRAILCHLTSDDAFASDFRQKLADAARVAPEAIIEINDLASLALHPEAPALAPFSSPGSDLWIGCRRPRAVRALLAYAKITLGAASINWLADASDVPSPPGAEPLRPWYPVIDRERCIACDQCRQYCLFGVYTKNPQGRIEVAQPLNCKPGCPACARICPAQAVIFPFCPERPINGDSPETAPAPRDIPAKLSLAQLAARRAATISPEAVEAALARRKAGSGKPD